MNYETTNSIQFVISIIVSVIVNVLLVVKIIVAAKYYINKYSGPDQLKKMSEDLIAVGYQKFKTLEATMTQDLTTKKDDTNNNNINTPT